MPVFQVRYWFDSSSRDKSGEQITETLEAAGLSEAAAQVQGKMEKPTFLVLRGFGPAQNVGVAVINTAQVRYVEIVPAANSLGGVSVT